MKVGHKVVAHWFRLQLARRAEPAQQRSAQRPVELTGAQLRHVAGGDGPAQSPNKTW
jgi:hypothetical protein